MAIQSISRISTKKGFKSQEGFLDIINELEDGYFEADLKGNLKLVNAAMSRLFGYSEDEMIGMNNRSYTDPEVAKKIYSNFNKVYRTGKPERGVEYEIIKKNGERAIADVSVSLIKDEKDNGVGFRGVIRDITRRKQMEEQLRLSEMRYRSILEEINELYFETDLHGVITLCNSAVESTLKYSNQEIIGTNYDRFIAEESIPDFAHAIKFPQNDSSSSQFELYLKTKTGEKLCVESRIFAIINELGDIEGYRGVARDITARKKAEEELLDYKKHLEKIVEKRTKELSDAKNAAEKADRAKSEFLSNISHELRTPLHGILSFSRFGIEQSSDSGKAKTFTYFQRIYQSGHRLMFLVDDLLEIANLESGKIRYNMEKHNLSDIMKFVLESYESKLKDKNIQIVHKIDADSTQLICDSNKIAHTVRNLMSNAIRYSDNDSRISILIEDAKYEKEEPFDSSLLFSIADQGIGIPEEELESVFGKFKQSSRTVTGAGGIGLGLSICKEIIEGHNGKIWAELIPEGGTKVSFAIPKGQSH